MKNKNILVTIYIGLVALGSFLLATYVESAKVTDFIVNERTRIEEDDHRLLLATAIANRNDGSDAFIIKNPKLSLDIEEENISTEIYVYSISLFNEQASTNVWAIYMKNLWIEDDLVVHDENDPRIQVELTFNQSIELGSSSTNTSLETFTTLYTPASKLIFIETDSLMEKYPGLNVEQVVFSYPLTSGQSIPFYSFTLNEVQQVQWENESLYAIYGDEYHESMEIVYDATLLKSLASLNYYYVTHFGAYIVFISASTYILFFKKRKETVN